MKFKSRLFHLIKKEFIQLKRDKSMLPMIFILPIVQLLLFGYVATTDIKNLSLAIIDKDNTQTSKSLARSLTNAGYFKVNKYLKNDGDISRTLAHGDAIMAVNIPPNFQRDVMSGKTAVVQLVIDGTNSNTASIALNYASQIFIKFSQSFSPGKILPASIKIPSIELRKRILFNPESKSVYYMVPGLFALILMISTTSNSSQALVKEREKGTLEQLIVTPIKRHELILGKILPYAIVSLAQTTLIFLFGLFWFGVPFRGNVLLLYIVSIIFLLASLGQGLFVSTVSKTRQQAILTTMIFMMPAFMLSGFIFPVENMPKSIYYLSYLVPMRYFLVIVRGMFLKGTGVSELWPQIVMLSVFAVAIFALSVMRFHKKFSD
jgi:ABC-2 type transport system permease protein